MSKPRLLKCFLGPMLDGERTPGVQCRAIVNVYRLADTDEYVCRLDGYPEADSFHTDKADAFATAQHMADHVKRLKS